MAMRFAPVLPLTARSLVGLALCAALAACGEKAADNGASTASNEVLQGSTSDAMIAFDQLRSQGQQAEPTDGAGEGANEGAAGMTRNRAPATGTAAATGAGDAGPEEADAPPAAEPAAPGSDDEG